MRKKPDIEILPPDPADGVELSPPEKRKRGPGRPKGKKGKHVVLPSNATSKDPGPKATPKEIKNYLLSFWDAEAARDWVKKNYETYLLKILVPLVRAETDITALGMPQIVYLSHPPMRDYDKLRPNPRAPEVDEVMVYSGTQRLPVDEAGRA